MKLLLIYHFGRKYTSHLIQDFRFEKRQLLNGQNTGGYLACLNQKLEERLQVMSHRPAPLFCWFGFLALPSATPGLCVNR
jgi:hypothetical protein